MSSHQGALEEWDIVVVTFNSAEELDTIWRDLPENLRSRVICVDNSSTDDSLTIARSLFPTVFSHANDGLSVANNFGAQQGRAKYVLFANPDLAPEADDFERIAVHLDRYGGLTSPRLVGDDGQPQENARGWPVLKDQLNNRFAPQLSRGYRWPIPQHVDALVPWLLGASIAVSREDFSVIGGWPEDYFLYYEDVVLALNAWSLGLPVSILGSMAWHHSWAKSSRHLWHRSTRSHIRSAAHFFHDYPEFLIRCPAQFRKIDFTYLL